MRCVWKKTISLTLSCLLLLGSLPLTALAEEVQEEILPEETAQETIQVAHPETTPAKARSIDNEPEDVETYPVWVNDVQLTSESEEYQSGEITYDPANHTLILSDTTLTSLVLEEEMTLQLWGNVTICNSSSGIALLAQSALTIQGSYFSLQVTSNGPTAMQVNGWQQGETRKGLTVRNNVTLQVSSTAVAPQTPVALTSPNGVVLSGDSHVSLGHTNFGETYSFANSDHVKIGSGDYATGSDSWAADGSSMTFVGSEHVQWQRDAYSHYKTCADSTCPLRSGLQLELDSHNTDREANCQQNAHCKTCGEYGDKNNANHAGEAVYEYDTQEHWQEYSCCEKEVSDSRASHVLTAVTDGNVIAYRCGSCAYNPHIKLQKKESISYVYDGDPKEVEVVDELNDEQPTITYYDGETSLQGPPADAGIYRAEVTCQDTVSSDNITISLTYTIAPKTLDDSMVTLSASEGIYGEATIAPTVTVKDGITYRCAYTKGDQTSDNPEDIDWAGVGTVTITVTGIDNYAGTVTKTYTIRQAQPKASQFQVEPPTDLTYNGTEKKANVTLAEDVTGMGTYTVSYSDTPIHAGTYQVSVQVAGDGAYAAETVTSENWNFTILPTDQYTDTTVKSQTLGDGVGEFQAPTFVGIGGETLEGTCSYTIGNVPISESMLKSQLSQLADGDSATVGYTFTPEAGGDYTGTKAGTIQVKMVKMTFTLSGGEPVTDAAIVKTGTISYGDKDIIDLRKLVAKCNGVTDPDPAHFTVKYTADDGATLLDAPGTGAYQFIVFYSNPDLGGYAVENAEVCRGRIYVSPKKVDFAKSGTPKAEILIEKEDGSAQPLLTKDNAGALEDGLKLEYSLTESGEYSPEIPTADKPGKYTVFYRAQKDPNYNTEDIKGNVDVVIYPRLTATYGQTLADLELPTGFLLNETKNPPSTSVGTAGNHSVYLDYGEPSLKGVEVPLTVKAKPITVTFEILERDRYLPYNKGQAVEAKISQVWNVTDNCPLPTEQYTLLYEGSTGRGEATVKPVTVGNYDFTAQAQSYRIYDLAAATLTDNAKISDAVKAAGYADGKSIREALSLKFPEGYPASRRKYTYFIMKQGDGQYDYNAQDWPTDGVAMKIAYPTGTDRKDAFKVYGMYLADCGDIKAGTIVELKEAKDTLQLGEYVRYDDRICLKMPAYMAVAIGAEAEQYTLKRTSSTRGTITFTVGSDTTAQTTAKVRSGETVTVKITDIQDKYGVSMVEYYETDLGYKSSDPKKATKNSDGTYSFEMPEYDTTIKVTIRKTSGNPSTGDVIRFWVELMVISGVAAGCLLVWRKKRK